MFEAAQNPSEYPAPTVTTLEKNEKRRAEPAKVAMPAGVVGVAVRSSADTLNSDFDSAKEDDFEDVSFTWAVMSSVMEGTAMLVGLVHRLKRHF